jgi:ElaB/YqjD/DUF883 family membrane-anchored ribosome-binding protein
LLQQIINGRHAMSETTRKSAKKAVEDAQKELEAAADEVTSEIRETVSDVSDDVNERLDKLGKELESRADAARVGMVGKLREATARLREQIDKGDLSGDDLAQAQEALEKLESGIDYVEKHSVGEIADDIQRESTEAITENPWQAVLIALVIGFIIGIIVKR